MNRRAFLGSIVGVATFGWHARHTNAGTVFGHDQTPEGFPEFNWIDFPEPISDSVMPYRGDYFVSSPAGIYRVSGIDGPFTVTTNRHGVKCRLWARHIDIDRAVVQLWHRGS